ncbi:MAG: serine hydrolase domain-containing protein [Rhizomicrobium sp.]|jgi:CubicO group peptidase (beta-lactamase class C family)
MTKPETLGFSSTRLARIDRFLKDRYVESGKLAGFQLKIARRGEIVHDSAAGLADRERNVPVREDTIFRIYSMTKPITSVAFMMLVEEGLVALDDPVHRHIPAWRDLGVFVAGGPGAFQTKRTAAPMRIVDLLRHTSGLTYGFQARTNVDAAYRELHIGHAAIGADAPKKLLNLDEMIEALAKVPLEFSPGTAWNYSVSTDVLGYLVGKISGVPFDEFLAKRIFDPLGMTDTAFLVPAGKASRLAACYALDAKGRTVLQDDPEKSAFLKEPECLSGGGGLVGTASDYMKFCNMLVHRGAGNGHRLLSPKTIELMRMNHLPGDRQLVDMSISLFSEAAYAGLGFGLGFGVTTNVAQTMTPGSLGEYYWGGAASTAFWVDPVEDIAVVFMTQLMPSTIYPIRRELRTMVYAALES